MIDDPTTIINVIQTIPLYAVSLFAVIANLFPFIPEEIFLVALGYLLASQEAITIPIIILLIIGFLVADSFLYWMAWRQSTWVQKLRNKFLHIRALKDNEFIITHAFKIVFISRFLIYIRFIGPVLSGSAHVPYRKFILSDMVALMVYVPFIIFVGQYSHERINAIVSGFSVANNLVGLAVALIGIGFLMWGLKKFLFKRLEKKYNSTRDFFGISPDDEKQ